MDSGVVFRFGVRGFLDRHAWLIVDDYMMLDTHRSSSDTIQLVCWRGLMRKLRAASPMLKAV
jgi:hypothetical protein